MLGIRATAEPDDHGTADRLARSCEGVVKAIVAGHVDAGALFDHACLVIPSSGPGWPDDTAWLVAGCCGSPHNETASDSWAEAVSYCPFTLLRSTRDTPWTEALLTVRERSDVLVIGGGIVGAASAYYLARAGVPVTLLEAETLAWGATGRNLGFIWVHTRKVGPELDLVMNTRARLPELVEELGEDAEVQTNGGMVFYSDERQGPVMAEFVAQRVADGLPM